MASSIGSAIAGALAHLVPGGGGHPAFPNSLAPRPFGGGTPGGLQQDRWVPPPARSGNSVVPIHADIQIDGETIGEGTIHVAVGSPHVLPPLPFAHAPVEMAI
jgi:hypothetical protein